MTATSDTPTLKIALAMRDPALRAQGNAVLSEHGASVTEITGLADVMYTVREAQPDLLLLDLDAPAGDLVSCVRVLHRNPQTKGTAVVVAVPPGKDKTVLVELAQAGAVGILVKPLDWRHLLERLQQYVQKGNTAAHDPHAGEQGATHVPDNSSLLMHRLICPFHENGEPFWHYTLRAGKVATEMNFFDVPVYTEATKGSVYVNYHLLAVAVCPTCFFASNNPDYFQQPGNRRATPHSFDPATVVAMMASAPDRQKHAAGLSRQFVSAQRPMADALVAYDLAILTSRQLHHCNPHAFAIELARVGNYYLRKAVLMEKQPGVTVEAVREVYGKAVESLREAYVYLQGPAFYRNIYQLMAALIYLADDAGAYQYFSRFKELEQSPPAAPGERATMLRYSAQCQKAWEDREYHRAPA